MNHKIIPLTRNKVTIVDENYYDFLMQWKWNFSTTGYAARCVYLGNYKSTTIKMHRIIMNASTEMQVDHINGDKLDNRRCNLRLCTNRENARNVKNHSDSLSKYKGVSWHRKKGKWHTRICLNYRTIHIGYFDTKERAALAYNIKATELFGEFAKLNPL